MEDRKVIKIIAPISFMFLGIAILIASLIIQIQSRQQADQGKTIYTESVEAEEEDILKAENDRYLAYNENCDMASYQKLNNVLGYIEIPAIDIKYPILKGETEENLSKGIAHVSETAIPMGTKGTTAVLLGHNGEFGNELFTHLDELTEYDQVLITILGNTYTYEVESTEVVLPEEVTWESDENKANLSLITCTPYGVNTHRLIVRCSM